MDIIDPIGFDGTPRSLSYTRRISLDVYSGRLRDGTTVALKAIIRKYSRHPDTLPDTEDVLVRKETMQKILDIWAKCTHPNIVQLIGKVTFRGKTAVVYGWHEYGGIREYLACHPLADRYQLCAQICEGVTHLHANGIIHGNLKGEQILVSDNGIPRIILSPATSAICIGTVMRYSNRNVSWRAPELVRLGPSCTLAGDIYALGMTILEAITWDFPYYGADNYMISVHQMVALGKLPPRPTDIVPETEAGNTIWSILCKCWSYNPEDRPTASQVYGVMHMVYQASNGVQFKSPRLVVREETSIHDLVLHFEQRGLMNYTEILHPASIVTAALVADTALANVYRVELLHHKPIAVKSVKHNTPYKRLKRAARELSCWSSYSHENILPLIGFAVLGGDLAMISPWMSGGCITDFIATNPNCNRLGLCTQLARAIAYLHEENMVHGDIKGPNVLVSDEGIVQVTDFGVSITDHQEIEFSTTSAGGGTQRWQAPEILRGDSDSSMEADVYALGMTMTEIYTGERPYNSINLFQAIQRVISGNLRPSRPIILSVDVTGNIVWDLMNRCWAENPAQRPTSKCAYERLKSL
ncbi:kinase-like domain-containing protein [Rhizoctonia solani]|nr:kinase-like domain-containing protein [Rhizoctonia solani]